MKVGKIFASAGCGKTTQLLNLLDRAFDTGAKPERVLFTTFTRAGAYEAKDRAIEKFGFPEERFPYFRTLHSICYRALGSPELCTRNDYRILSKNLHIRFGSAGLGDELYEKGKGDALLALYNLQRNMQAEENLVPEEYGLRVSQEEYAHFVTSYENYRVDNAVHDYVDLLTELLAEARSGMFHGLPIDYAFIDEAQDLTNLQNLVIRKLTKHAKELWFAGDDDQCIFSYSGANPNILIDMRVKEQLILEKTYRLPPCISDYANKIVHRISRRQPKVIQSMEEKEGYVQISNDLSSLLVEGESTTLLARNRVFLSYFEEILKREAFLYTFVKASSAEELLNRSDMLQIREAILTWETMLLDPERKFPKKTVLTLSQFFPTNLFSNKNKRAMKVSDEPAFSYLDLTENFGLLAQHGWEKSLKRIPAASFEYMQTLIRLKRLDKTPHIKLGTIHSFKGKEDDHVVVLPDMGWQTWMHFQERPDDEHRVFYVAVTRSKRKLTLLQPISKYSYPWE